MEGSATVAAFVGAGAGVGAARTGESLVCAGKKWRRGTGLYVAQASGGAPKVRMVATGPQRTSVDKEVGTEAVTKLGKVEALKLESHHLRYPLVDEMSNEEVFITENAMQVMKFHGSYQQDNRELRRPGQPKHWQFMLRLKMPAGEFPRQMYQMLDDLSDDYGNHTLRATTRCAFQMHGVLKGNMKTVLGKIMNAGGSTMGACGDISRNVVATPAPFATAPYTYVREYAKYIAEILAPQTGAFAEIWLDGEKAASVEYWKKDIDMNEVQKIIKKDNKRGVVIKNNEEPIYGDRYLPRKFKVGITVPGDNSIDIYTQDIGLVVICNAAGELQGFNVTVGGGMGRTHGKENTFARTGDHLGFVRKDKVFDLIKAIVATQRDHGNREHRPNARMKYLVDKLGIDEFRKLVESYYGASISRWRSLPTWKYEDFMGWHEQGDGKWFMGLFVENGRIKNEGSFQLKRALRYLMDELDINMVVSPNQNIILKDIEQKHKGMVVQVLKDHGVPMPDEYSRNRVTAMACPAFPLCGLAVTEAERHFPSVVDRVDNLLDKMGLKRTNIIMRMTGCPNGCVRPYMAEIGFVGSGPLMYQLWLGGTPGATQLAFPYMEKVKDAAIESVLEPVFACFAQNRKRNEPFGTFCARYGKEALEAFAASYTPGAISKRVLKKVAMDEETHAKLVKAAETRKTTVKALLDDLITSNL
ncbi:Sulfite reductase, ferredoxin [Porphyridium purpureum]|uniref:assimilatory sulfite reductase (ferredoxin) n=1 Tax=Porphyridium purpureum TaxID=35688 RepID=A0A5J4YRC4_PORPP|nr:Sulfite reductase, ferredoxin [Porphyridium purpureum]|eukprot:POR7632..scf236_6